MILPEMLNENISKMMATTLLEISDNDSITSTIEISSETIDSALQDIHLATSPINISDIIGPQRDSLYIVIPITFIYVLIFIAGVIGNLSTCIVISRNRSMHTTTNFYLFSLAISDVLLLVSSMPPEIYTIWVKYPYVFGEAFCIVRGIFCEMATNATVLIITTFSVERYLAICHPFVSHKMPGLRRCVLIIISIWFTSLVLAIPQALQFEVKQYLIVEHTIDQCQPTKIIFEHSFEVASILFFFTPMGLITVLYILIGFKLRSSNLITREYGSAHYQRTDTNATVPSPSMATRRVLKMLVAVVVAFFCCWAPFHTQRLVAKYFNNVHDDDDVAIYTICTYISGVLYYLSTCINPFLYNIMSNKFRNAFKDAMTRFWATIWSSNNRREESYSFDTLSSRPSTRLSRFGTRTSASSREESSVFTTLPAK